MKRKTNVKLLLGILLIFLAILLNSKSSYASVEIKPSTSSVLVNTTVSNSYLLCQQMKDSGQALGRTSVVPHLATNKDWGAVSYLSNSSYGTNTAGQNTGTTVTINSKNYYSTNGNLTGVMDWGKTITQTSALIQSYDPSSNSAATYVTTLYENKDTRFVESIGSKTGMAMHGWYSSSNDSGTIYPISVRLGLFGSAVGRHLGGDPNWSYASGAAYKNVTFRPVVWNE